MLVPKLVSTLRDYDRAQLGRDLAAGTIVGIVALPLAIAFAIASGVTPGRGLWTAIVAGFLISALGGSRVQIGGPTGAFVVIVYGIVQKYGIDGLTVATLPWRRDIPRGVSVFEINGPLFFGAVETFRETLDTLAVHPRVLIIRMRDVHALDSTGIHALKDVVRRSRRAGSDVLFTEVQAQPLAALTASGTLDDIGTGNVFPEIDDALARAYEAAPHGANG